MKTGVIYCPNHWGFKSQKKKHDEIIDALDKYLPGYDFVQSESADSVERLVNMMIDNGTDIELVKNLYPELSKYNDTKSPNIQTFLAGIYRKTKIPDAFGPLVKMLIQDSINPPQNCHFDPTEEIGGAILDYLA